jgi:hypothetical protein
MALSMVLSSEAHPIGSVISHSGNSSAVTSLCGKGADCRYKHGRLDKLTRLSAMKLITTMPGWLQECLTPLVASCKAFKA